MYFMKSDPRNQTKEGTNQDVNLTNNDESLIDNSLEEPTALTPEAADTKENTSLTQLIRDDGEITHDFTDGDDPDFEVV